MQHFAWILCGNKQVKEYIYNIQHIYSQIIFFFYFQYDFAEKSTQSCWSVNLKYSVNMSACVKFSRRDNGEPILLVFEYYFSFIIWEHLVHRVHSTFSSSQNEWRGESAWFDVIFFSFGPCFYSMDNSRAKALCINNMVCKSGLFISFAHTHSQ